MDQQKGSSDMRNQTEPAPPTESSPFLGKSRIIEVKQTLMERTDDCR
jgi:hypothetical protein